MDIWLIGASNGQVSTFPAICAAGLAIGVLYGLFGVGGAFATPLLATLGVPGMAAIVGPLPGLLPGSAAGAWRYSRRGTVDADLARRMILGALPAAVLGSVVSQWVGGPVLLGLSGAVLLLAGVRMLKPGSLDAGCTPAAARRRESGAFIVVSAAGVGFASGLLANGGGFLLVPLFLLALGLDMRTATGTSLVVVAALTVPTLVTHALFGHIDWVVSAAFAVGVVPGVLVGAWLAHRLVATRLRLAFGVLLVGFAAWFVLRQVLAAGP